MEAEVAISFHALPIISYLSYHVMFIIIDQTTATTTATYAISDGSQCL